MSHLKALFVVTFWVYQYVLLCFPFGNLVLVLPRVNTVLPEFMCWCRIWSSLKPLSEKQGFSTCYAQTYVVSILLPLKNSVIKLLNSLSDSVFTSFVLYRSSATSAFSESKIIAKYRGFFHLTHNITITFVDCISFSWLSINALTCASTW